jgi:hypothetical protein
MFNCPKIGNSHTQANRSISDPEEILETREMRDLAKMCASYIERWVGVHLELQKCELSRKFNPRFPIVDVSPFLDPMILFEHIQYLKLKQYEHLEPFISKTKCSIENYAFRLIRYLELTFDDIAYALCILERFVVECRHNNRFVLNPLSIHKLLMTSILITLIINDDKFYPDPLYAKITGTLIQNMTKCKITFLMQIDFAVYIPPDAVAQMQCDLREIQKIEHLTV